jgi:hypothetical protein
VAAADAYLFRPAVAYRLRRNLNTDTPLPPEEPAGQNPPDGAILDYHLGSAVPGPAGAEEPAVDTADPDDASPGTPVVLEILDGKGQLVRRYSSADRPEPVDPKELAVPTYWVRMPRVLPGRPGMHRFVWDLRYPPPEVLDREYPISAIYRDTPREPLGPFVLAGTYTVRLTVAGKSSTQPLTVRMDPRVKTSREGLAGQLALAQRIVAALHRDSEALGKIKAVRTKLQGLPAAAKEGALGTSVQALDGQLTALVSGEEKGKDNLTGMNGSLSRLYRAVEEADLPPTSQMRTTAADLERRLADLLARWNGLSTREVPALDGELKKAGLPGLQ